MIDGDFGIMLRSGVIALMLSVPLAVWKLVDISVWIFQHVHIK
jgi:hypothetical protein